MDETAKIAVNRVWTLVAGVLAALRALPGFGGAFLPGPVWARAFRDLRLAEAAARRALFVMAAAEARPRPPAPNNMPPAPEAVVDLSPSLSPKTNANEPTEAISPEVKSRSGQAPAGRSGRPRGGVGGADNSRERNRPRPFNLSDTLQDPMVLAGLVERAGPAGPIVPSGAPRPLAGLKARIAALQAVLDDPGPALARFLARRYRPRRHIFDKGCAPRLRPGHPPGYVRTRHLDWHMDVLMEIHLLAWHGRDGPPGALAEP